VSVIDFSHCICIPRRDGVIKRNVSVIDFSHCICIPRRDGVVKRNVSVVDENVLLLTEKYRELLWNVKHQFYYHKIKTKLKKTMRGKKFRNVYNGRSEKKINALLSAKRENINKNKKKFSERMYRCGKESSLYQEQRAHSRETK